MLASDPRLFFDFVDPLSWVLERALTRIETGGGIPVARVGVELRPPPAPLTRASDAFWAERVAEAARVEPAAPLAPPMLVPWTRKAHELHLFASTRDAEAVVRRRLFEAHFEHGRDIGRVDELVAIAVAAGLDRTEAKAALDVDKHLDDVLAQRRNAAAAGVEELPALLVGGKVLQGFHNLPDLGTLLGGSLPGGR